MRAASGVPARTRASAHAALWWQIARRSFLRISTYRAATAAGVFTNTVFGFLRVYILLAVLDARPGLAGYDEADIATYTFVTQGLLATVYSFAADEIAERVRTGEIVGDLYRPVDFQGYWLASDVGRFAFQLLFRGIPPVVLGSLVFDLALPADVGTWLAFLTSVCVALVVSFGIRYLASLSAFWLLDTRGVWQMTAVVSMFLAGMMVPLGFLPHDIAQVVLWLPFAAISQLSIDVLLGHADVAPVLARQAMWAVALIVLGRVVTRRAFRKVVVQGG